MTSGLRSTSLLSVPPAQRQRGALFLAVVAVLLLSVGVLPLLSAAPIVVRLMAGLCVVAGVGAGLVAWGLVRSVRLEAREARVDAAIAEIAGSCDCGHDHTPPARQPACPTGEHCEGTCVSCVLSRP